MTKIVHPPRRRGYRRRVHIPYGEVVRERDFRVVSSLTLDLSPFGAMVRADRPVLTGEEVILSLRPSNREHWADVLATVTRVVHGRRRADSDGLCLGLSFHDVDPETLRALYVSMASPETRRLPPQRRAG
jgi:hypothetical protein